MKTVAASGEKGILQMGMATHAGMTADDFTRIVDDWIKTAKHPRFKKLYTQCVYLPELRFHTISETSGIEYLAAVRTLEDQ